MIKECGKMEGIEGLKFTERLKMLNRFRRKMKESSKRAARLKRALYYTKPYRLFVTGILVLTLVIAAMNALEPLVMKYIFDRLGNGKTAEALLMGAGLLLGLGIFKEIFSGITNWLTWRTRINIHYNLLDATVSKLHRLPHDVHRKEGVGALMTKLDRGISGFITAISEISFNVLPAIAYLTLALLVMFNLDWKLTILVAVFAPMPAVIAALAAQKQTNREQSLMEKWIKIYSRFNEVLSGIVTVRSFAMEDSEKQRFLRDVNNANKIVVNGVKYDAAINVSQNMVIMLARIAAVAFGGFLIIKGEATLGTLVAFLSYVGGLFGPVQGLTGIYKTLRTASVSLDQVFSILDAQDFLGDAPDAKELKNFNGTVSFENVHFSYNVSGNKILKGINMNVEKGESVAIVGPSGSGKSTLMALLMRFYDPSFGSIKLDGVDLRKLKQNWIRRQIGVVLQDALLFNDTVRNNIAYGKPDASEEEILNAAKAANAHEFIMKLENGYNTSVGERGGRLSVGERQRIAIARALLKNPPILILDEATSALDAELEALVQEALERLVAGRTTFIIAHRLSTVVNADRIMVLKEGRIAESGKHEDLLNYKGYYAHLVKTQTKGLVAPSIMN